MYKSRPDRSTGWRHARGGATMFRRQLITRTAVVAGVAGALAVLPLAMPADSAVKPASVTPIYQDRSYSFAERAADLVSRMTLAQKASQMNSSFSPAIASLGVPQWGWWNEALHGVAREQLLNNANATTLTNTKSYPDDQ